MRQRGFEKKFWDCKLSKTKFSLHFLSFFFCFCFLFLYFFSRKGKTVKKRGVETPHNLKLLRNLLPFSLENGAFVKLGKKHRLRVRLLVYHSQIDNFGIKIVYRIIYFPNIIWENTFEFSLHFKTKYLFYSSQITKYKRKVLFKVFFLGFVVFLSNKIFHSPSISLQK